jgi:acetate---CoA ligase (ADP-forming)
MDRIEKAYEITAQAKAKGKRTLSEHESKSLLALYEIPAIEEVVVHNQNELDRVLKSGQFKYPLVMKIDSPDISHKTEAGLVKLNVNNETEALEAYKEILDKSLKYDPDASINGVLVQTMLRGAVAECIIGMTQDTQFGPVLMFGLGGLWVEVFEDIAIRLPPLSHRDASIMVQDIKGHMLLQGFRNYPAADKEAIVDILVKMSTMALELTDCVAEVDINPVLVFKEGCGAKAVDSLVRIF